MSDSSGPMPRRGEKAGPPGRVAVDRIGKRPKKPYVSPRLERYGKLSEVTRFGGSRVVDSGANFGNLPLQP